MCLYWSRRSTVRSSPALPSAGPTGRSCTGRSARTHVPLRMTRSDGLGSVRPPRRLGRPHLRPPAQRPHMNRRRLVRAGAAGLCVGWTRRRDRMDLGVPRLRPRVGAGPSRVPPRTARSRSGARPCRRGQGRRRDRCAAVRVGRQPQPRAPSREEQRGEQPDDRGERGGEHDGRRRPGAWRIPLDTTGGRKRRGEARVSVSRR